MMLLSYDGDEKPQKDLALFNAQRNSTSIVGSEEKGRSARKGAATGEGKGEGEKI